MEGVVHPDFGAVTEQLRRINARPSEFGGAAVAVYHRGELVVDAWIGARDGAGRPWRRDSMAMSFSTTKGVVATVVHRLVDRGELAYDEPVATWWPEFAAAGKERITLRQLLSHQAGLHPIRPLVASAEDLLDWDRMVARLAAAAPVWPPGTRPGYQAITYGYLVGELVRRVTGASVDEAVRREIAEPLGLDGLRIGLPPGERDRAVELLLDPRVERRLLRLFGRLQRFDATRPVVDALAIDDFLDVARTGRLLDGEVPAANGMFTARDLARMYAALATPEAFDHPPLVSATTLREATRVQTTARDAVVMLPMYWRLGYHSAATTAGIPPRGFGHFGFGGSGAWGDPVSGLAVAMVVNRIGGTPFADTRMLRIGGAALRAARRR
jgi:CubicO group peptidase (beta-lactamase class C family)